MRLGPTDEAVAGSIGWTPVVSAWKGGQVIAVDVPVAGGHVTADVSQNVPEKLTLVVPRFSTVNGRRFDWRPASFDAPLARYGQTLSVQIRTKSSVTGTVWTTRVGMYRIQSWAVQSDYSIQVEAVGMLQAVAGNRLSSPLSPLAGGTLVSEFRRLLPSGFSVSVDPALTDRACPSSMSWEDDRLAALYDIADAWPARLRTTEDGFRLALLPPLPSTITARPSIRLADGARGTVVAAPTMDTRDKAYNRVTASCSATDSTASTPLRVTVDQPSGPLSTSGDYGVEEMKWSSPLATTVDSLTASALTLLANNLRPARTLKVTCATDPRLDVDDAVEVVYDGRTAWGWVIGYDLPLLADGGPMQLNVGVSQ